MHTVRPALLWAVAWVATFVLVFPVLIGVRAFVTAVPSEALSRSVAIALGSALYLLPFVLLIVFVVGLPICVILTLGWAALAQSGMIPDSLGAARVTAVLAGPVAVVAFLFVRDFEITTFPVDSLVTSAIIWISVSSGLLLPRLLLSDLAFGRFAPTTSADPS